LVRLLPPSIPSQLLPTPFKAIARGFVILFHIRLWSQSTIFPHFHLLHSPNSLLQVPPHCNYFIVLSFIINSKLYIQKGFLMYPSCEYTLVSSTPLLLTKNLWLHTHSLNFAKDKTLTWFIKPIDLFIKYSKSQHFRGWGKSI
jgi:hypothetical protein